MASKQSMAKGFTILGVTSILNKVLSVIYVPFLTLMIGDVGNGIANAGYVIYLLIYQVTYMGIPVALSKMVSEQVATGRYQDSLRTLKIAATMMLVIGVALGGAMALGAGWIARLVGRPESAMTLLALSPTVLIASVSASVRGYFQGRHNMVPTSVSQVLEQAANTVFTLLFAWLMLRFGQQQAALIGIVDPEQVRLYSLQWGAAGSGLGTTAGALVSAGYLFFVVARGWRGIRAEVYQKDLSHLARGRARIKSQRLTGQLISQILKYAVPITLGSIIVYSANLVDLKFTNQRLEAGGFSATEATALFGILTTQYNKIINVPLALANTLAVVLLPGISGIAALNDREGLNAKIGNGFRAVFMITLPSAALLAVLAEPVIRLLFPRNVHGMDLMWIGSWVIVPMALAQLQTSVLQGLGRMRLPVAHMAAGLVLKIAVNYVLIGIPQINVRGAVAGSAVCYGVATLWNYVSIRRETGFRIKWRRQFLPAFAASLALAAVAWGVWSGLELLLRGMIDSAWLASLVCMVPAVLMGGAAYAVTLLLCRGVYKAEVMRIPLLPKLVGRQRLERMLDRLQGL